LHIAASTTGVEGEDIERRVEQWSSAKLAIF